MPSNIFPPNQPTNVQNGPPPPRTSESLGGASLRRVMVGSEKVWAAKVKVVKVGILGIPKIYQPKPKHEQKISLNRKNKQINRHEQKSTNLKQPNKTKYKPNKQT